MTHWYRNNPNGRLDYACQDKSPGAGYIEGPPPIDGKTIKMVWDSSLWRVRAKKQAELAQDAQAQADKEAGMQSAQAALEAVSPEALNQLAQGFVGQLDQVKLPPQAKQALSELITQAVGCIGHLRDLVVLNMGGSRG